MGIPVPDTGSVTEDTGVVGGNLVTSGDIDFWFGSDAGAWTAQTIAGAYGSQLVIDSSGRWTYTASNANAAIQALDTGQTLTEVFNVTSTGGASTITITINGLDEPPCFVAGTLIDTPQGPRAVETLAPGDLVLTRDRGAQPLRWTGRRLLDFARGGRDFALREGFRPIRIAAGAFGPGRPAADLCLSPMHRVLLAGATAELMFATPEVLCPAHLLAAPGIATDPAPQVAYHHLFFDRHEIVTANGLPCETFYPGHVGLGGFEAAARTELLALFPELGCLPRSYGPAARYVLRRFEARALAACSRACTSRRSVAQPSASRPGPVAQLDRARTF